jgi:hypothetical protein
MTYYETGLAVAAALNAGHGLTVEMDPGTLTLTAAELRWEWDNLAPGEAFTVTPCELCKTTTEPHKYHVQEGHMAGEGAWA